MKQFSVRSQIANYFPPASCSAWERPKRAARSVCIPFSQPHRRRTALPAGLRAQTDRGRAPPTALPPGNTRVLQFLPLLDSVEHVLAGEKRPQNVLVEVSLLMSLLVNQLERPLCLFPGDSPQQPLFSPSHHEPQQASGPESPLCVSHAHGPSPIPGEPGNITSTSQMRKLSPGAFH